MINNFATGIAVLMLSAGLAAQPSDGRMTADHHNISGTWNMGLQGGHVIPVALVLEQDGKKLTGTIALPTQNAGQRVEVSLTGEMTDGAFTLSGTVEGAKEPTTIDITGKLTDEGSLEGTMTSPHGRMSYTAERLKERK
jgi:hypothetical protein